MILPHLIQLFERDLNRLSEQVSQFSEEHLWLTPKGITNSAGHLTLHLCGNLRHFIGTVLGDTSYVRDRSREFRSEPLPKSQLENEIRIAQKEVEATLKTLNESDLEIPFPLDVFGYEMTTSYFLMHLQGHLNYHLGQIDYLRRILSKKD